MDAQNVHLTRPSEVRAYLRLLGFTPRKSMGQNFLVDAHLRDRIADASETAPGERVIEIGPGLGVMTEALLHRGARVTAIELDFRLSEHLRHRFSEHRNLTLIQGDATKVHWSPLLRPDPVRVVSNLPYSVGSRILYDLADPVLAPVSITVMVQRDVADRILSGPGDDLHGHLGVRMGWTYTATRVHHVSGSCFLPPPRVGSSVLHLRRRATPPAPLHDFAILERLVAFAFTRRRKQLRSILRDYGHPDPPTELDLARRPETLSLPEWAALANALTP